MKKATIGRLVFLALMLCLVTVTLFGGTLASYTAPSGSPETAPVAEWCYKTDGHAAAVANVALTDTELNSRVSTGKIAPGTNGSFDIDIDASGSDSGVIYTITFGSVKNKPVNLHFYSDAAFMEEIKDLREHIILGGIDLPDVNTRAVETIYWKWDYDADVTDNSALAEDVTFRISVVCVEQNDKI